MNNRHESLDLFRFFAALVVFLGHVIFFSQYGSGFKDEPWLQFIRTGTFAVDFFFALSGFVLRPRKPAGKWMASRIMRLYPVYFVGLCIGILVNLAASGSLGTDAVGVFLGFFGVQSLSSKYQLVLNPPLWSLSVEMISTPLFVCLYIVRDKKAYLYLGFVMSVILALSIQNSVVIRGLPFFILGSIISSLKRPDSSNRFTFALGIGLLFYFIIGANVLSHISYSFVDLLIKFLTLGLLIYSLLGVKFGARLSKLSSELGKRSYALYAVHGPLIGISLGLWNPTEFLPFLGYVATSVILTAVVSEVVYRFVDLWAIQKASHSLNSKS